MGRSGPNGGVYIDLAEEERKAAEKAAAAAAEQAASDAAEKKRRILDRRSELTWAYTFFVLGCGPAALALVTVLVGPLVHKVADKCAKQPLHTFVQLSIALAYAYLFLYTWMLMGPIPFKGRTKPLKVAFGAFALLCTVVYGIGAVLFAQGSACAEEAPTQYRYTQLQLALFLIGGGSAAAKFIRELVETKLEERRRAKRKELKAAIQNEVAAEEEEEEEEEEAEEEAQAGDEEEDEEEAEEDEEGQEIAEDVCDKEDEGQANDGNSRRVTGSKDDTNRVDGAPLDKPEQAKAGDSGSEAALGTSAAAGAAPGISRET